MSDLTRRTKEICCFRTGYRFITSVSAHLIVDRSCLNG